MTNIADIIAVACDPGGRSPPARQHCRSAGQPRASVSTPTTTRAVSAQPWEPPTNRTRLERRGLCVAVLEDHKMVRTRAMRAWLGLGLHALGVAIFALSLTTPWLLRCPAHSTRHRQLP